MKWAISVSQAGPLYRAGSAQALFPHKVVVVFIWEAEAEAEVEIPVARVEISESGSAHLVKTQSSQTGVS